MEKIIKLAKSIFSIGICFVLLWIVFNYLIGREIFNMYPIIGYLLTVVVCLKIALLLSILLQAIKKEGLKGVDIQVTRIGNLWIRSFLALYFFVFGINIGADHYYPLSSDNNPERISDFDMYRSDVVITKTQSSWYNMALLSLLYDFYWGTYASGRTY